MRAHPHFQRLLAAIAATGLLAGCGGPDHWAGNFEAAARCDLTLAQVESLSGRPAKQLEIPIGWMTHRTGSLDGTYVALGMRDGKLKALQVHWLQGPGRVANFQAVDLCGEMKEGAPYWSSRIR